MSTQNKIFKNIFQNLLITKFLTVYQQQKAAIDKPKFSRPVYPQLFQQQKTAIEKVVGKTLTKFYGGLNLFFIQKPKSAERKSAKQAERGIAGGMGACPIATEAAKNKRSGAVLSLRARIFCRRRKRSGEPLIFFIFLFKNFWYNNIIN